MWVPSWLYGRHHQQQEMPSSQTSCLYNRTWFLSCINHIHNHVLSIIKHLPNPKHSSKTDCIVSYFRDETKPVTVIRNTHVSENDFLVFLCRFETAIRAANCITVSMNHKKKTINWQQTCYNPSINHKYWNENLQSISRIYIMKLIWPLDLLRVPTKA